ncbi:cytochrome P450 [Streptomyces sp. NA04227]|uniref:cytochrome P450 n=1 Tax=Streptomyces sp. NA04227 TaxID=2742136 RepID=UPI001590825D|nr:cytochrome P450 [Streptomyces sp. NA04227]QKW08528.1 cytochrome P450 [Streptomyces sp. NA04227]
MGEIVPAPWGGHLVTGFETCNQILRSREWLVPDFDWQSRQTDTARWQATGTREMSKTLMRLNPPEHTRQRRSLGNLFDRNTIEDLRPQVDAHVTALLDRFDEQLRSGEADFVQIVGDLLPARTIGGWLGIPEQDDQYLLQLTHDQAHAHELLPKSSELALSAQATVELRTYFTELVRDRRAHLGDDVLSHWIRVWDELEPDRETADEMVYVLTMFVTVASLETTATLLSVVVWLLLQEPARWDWLRRNPEHIDDAIEEVLRYDPPIGLNSRVAAHDLELAGVPLPKDSMVHVLYGAANHDPRVNDDPHRFDILRRGNHLTFGGGIHYCLGAALARLEARTLLTRLLERFPTLRVATPPTYEPRMVFRRVRTLGLAL